MLYYRQHLFNKYLLSTLMHKSREKFHRFGSNCHQKVYNLLRKATNYTNYISQKIIQWLYFKIKIFQKNMNVFGDPITLIHSLLIYFMNKFRNRGIVTFTMLSAYFMKGPMFTNVYEFFTKIYNKFESILIFA